MAFWEFHVRFEQGFSFGDVVEKRGGGLGVFFRVLRLWRRRMRETKRERETRKEENEVEEEEDEA